ncbi:MAG: repeat protein, partial [Verrucomicrobiaceae bacterium]|nr:repeat protein [Verrucomicrobiaceae bacterium]
AARAGNKIALPANWAELKAKMISTKVEATLTELEAFMGVPEAKQAFRAQLADKALPSKQRDAALTLLMSVRDADTAPLLQEIIRSDDKALTHHAVQGLGTLSHPGTPALLIGKLGSFDAATKNEAINTLATNATGAKLLLTAVKKREVPMTMLSPFLARQMDSLKDEGVKGLLKEVWGDLNAPKADLPERKAKFRSLLTPAALAKAGAAKGRVMFNAICGQCHKLFGEGQNVGPDLTGSNRANLDYLLDNVLDPNAVIGKAYQLNIFELKDGRIASGVIKEETPAVYRIAMPGGFEQTLTVAEVRKHTVSPVSTMPEGLFEAMPKEQLIELVAYLQSHASEPAKGGAVVKIDEAIEGEDLKVLEVKGGNAKVQGMGGFGSLWSGAKQLWWTGAKPGATLTLELLVAEKGKYQLFGAVTQAKDYGIIDVSLDGKVVAANYDGFNGPKVIHSAELDWGAHNLDKGAHKLTFTIKGSNPKAVKSYMLGLDYVRLVKK